jgi:phage terminase large subunit GpA-like protein
MRYKFPKHSFPFYPHQADAFRIYDPPTVADWMESHFRLTTAYAIQGIVRLFPWQREPANAILKYDTVVFVAPVQTGKSLLAEGVLAYVIDTLRMNWIACYAKKETVMDVFDERLKPMVTEIPAIRRYWSGFEDDLTKRRIKLRHCIGRVASAGLRSDLATHGAGFVYGSELGKWPKKDFDQIKMLTGRQQSARMLGKSIKSLYETSPVDETDKSYQMAHRQGVLFLRPYMACPHCGEWQVLEDKHIKEKPDRKGNLDHNAERIRLSGAAFYQCPHCDKEITESDRITMADRVVWAADDERILPDGTIKGRNPSDTVVFNWNRLVDTTWPFAECLASYFEALGSPNPEDLKTYQNEDMARWVKITVKRFADTFIRSKCLKYKQHGADAYIPDRASVLLVGLDTQDTGFWFVVRAYGPNLESWLVRNDFIACDMHDERFHNPAEVFATLQTEIYRYPYEKANGKSLPILFGFIDRGGHRSKDVDYIVGHSANLAVYLGSTDKRAPLVEQKKSDIYWGNTENLSRIVQKQMESSIWHLPSDIGRDYCDQVLNQYDEEIVDNRGNRRKKWTKVDPDHCRDCENLLVAATLTLNLNEQLFDDTRVQELQEALQEEKGLIPDQAPTRERGPRGSIDQWLNGGGWG